MSVMRKIFLGAILAAATLWCVILYGPIDQSYGQRLLYELFAKSLEFEDDGGQAGAFNCSAIIQGDPMEVEKAKSLAITKDFREKVKVSEEYYINATMDCGNYIRTRKYPVFPLSREEGDFPLAYSIVVHHKVQNFERLLRAIYAPQNLYCVHVDRKVKPSTLASFMSITSCFPNVFVVSKSVSVTYAGWSRVQADINCMSDLYNISTAWKYFINLCGQDFPTKTNLEMVRRLQSLNGMNSINSQPPPANQHWRWANVHISEGNVMKGTNQKMPPPPFNIPIYYGSAYIIVSRAYVRATLEEGRVQTLIEWAKDSYSPDEILWATIQRMPEVPGSTAPNTKLDMTDLNSFARLVKWSGEEGPVGSRAAYLPCEGSHVRGVCVYGSGDLSWILKQQHLFANKFDVDSDYIALHCLDHYLRHKALTDALQIQSASELMRIGWGL